MTSPRRRDVLGGLLALPVLAAGCSDGCLGSSSASRARGAAGRGVEWVWSQQDPVGTFGSRVYGVMRLGHSLTPFTLLALSTLPADLGAIRLEPTGRAFAALLAMADSRGALGFAGTVLDFPVYATSLAISALAAIQPEGWESRAAPLLAWLGTQQFRAEAGWGNHPALGGFSMGQTEEREPPEAGHVDLSMTRRAVQAFAAAGSEVPDRGAALGFVRRCGSRDPGFVFSPVEPVLNKGKTPESGYGSATADGILAALALGTAPASPWLAAAVRALRAQHRLDENPGLAGGPRADWGPAMKGYYRAASAQVFHALGGPEGWRDALIEAIVAEQLPDGSWRGASPLQREDDPVIATGFALSALGAALSTPA